MNAEVIELGEANSGGTIKLNTEPLDDDTPKHSANFGAGAELLMNDKKKEGSGGPTSDINLADLNNLENELNDLAEETSGTPMREARNVMFESVPGGGSDLASGNLDDLDGDETADLKK